MKFFVEFDLNEDQAKMIKLMYLKGCITSKSPSVIENVLIEDMYLQGIVRIESKKGLNKYYLTQTGKMVYWKFFRKKEN